jgi:hypothetical protein
MSPTELCGLKASDDVISLSYGGELIFYGLDSGFKLGYLGTRIFKDRAESRRDIALRIPDKNERCCKFRA